MPVGRKSRVDTGLILEDKQKGEGATRGDRLESNTPNASKSALHLGTSINLETG